MVYPLPRRYRLAEEDVDPLSRGGGMKKDIDNMQYLSENMLGRTFCPLGDAAAMPTIAIREKISERI